MIIDEQVGNASQEVPESDFNEADFFGQLDRGVNAGILESEQTTFQESDNTQNEESPAQEVQQPETVETLKQRYSDSSKEGKRLSSRLKELEPYVPILDEMRKDPNLIQHVRGYFEGGGQTPSSMKEQLGLDEDFVYDADEALSSPDSDSGKLFHASVDGLVQRRLQQAMQAQKAETNKAMIEKQFQEKHGMSNTEWGDFVDYAKNKTLELDDIYFLKTRGERETNIAKSANKEVASLMKRAQQKPRSLATSGSAVVEKSNEDQLFDAILGIDKQLDNAFG